MNRKQVFAILFLLVFSLCSFLLSISLDEKRSFKSTFKSENNPTVIIDAGHGGEDGGAFKSGVYEKHINLSVSKKAEQLLNFFGVNTKMTRTTDTSLDTDTSKSLQQRKVSDIKKRVKMITDKPNSVLISIHQNSFPEEKYSGAQVFYSRNNVLGKVLASDIQNSLKTGLADGNSRIEKEADKNIYILEKVKCPAVLVECGFLTNKREAELLVTDTYRTKLAMCIVTGYLTNRNRGE